MLPLFANSSAMDQRVSAFLNCMPFFNHFSIGAIHTVWTGRSSVPIFLNNVDCRSSEATLLNCSHSRRDGGGYKCHYYSGVQCSEERLRVQNVNTAPVNSSNHTVMISWELYSDAPHEPTSFRVWCYNQQRVIEFSLWVSNETLTHVSVGGIVSSVSFACCVSFTYYYLGYYYEAEGKCASTDSNMLLPDSYVTPDPNQPVPTPSSTQMVPASIGSEEVVGSDLNMRASIIGGVLGSIIIILLLLLAICGGALLFLLRSRSMSPKM